MTIEERQSRLKAFITCLKCEVSGKCCDDNCPTQYDAGNIGAIIENLEAISKILEQEPNQEDYSTEILSTEEIFGLIEALQEQEPTTNKTLVVAKNATSKCISSEAVDRIINKWLSHPDYELKDHIYSMTKEIHNLPPVTPQNQKTGHWIEFPNHNAYKCSECGRMIMTVDGKKNVCRHFPYCHCGAKMESEVSK